MLEATKRLLKNQKEHEIFIYCAAFEVCLPFGTNLSLTVYLHSPNSLAHQWEILKCGNLPNLTI